MGLSVLKVKQPSLTIAYPGSDPRNYFVGESISLKPTITGTITNCSISPSLPSGIAFSSSDCSISGTSSAGVLGASYTVTATNAGGSNTVSIIFKIQNTTAIRVYGQFGSFTTNTANMGGSPSADTLSCPQSISTDSGGNIYITDSGNHRVLYYPAGSTTATRVWGQLGDFSTSTINKGGSVTSDTLNKIGGISVDLFGNIYSGSRQSQSFDVLKNILTD